MTSLNKPFLDKAADDFASEHPNPDPVVNDFHKILMPMIRRVVPGTIAQSIVGVQPMTEPQGLVFSMRYKYGEPEPDSGP